MDEVEGKKRGKALFVLSIVSLSFVALCVTVLFITLIRSLTGNASGLGDAIAMVYNFVFCLPAAIFFEILSLIFTGVYRKKTNKSKASKILSILSLVALLFIIGVSMAIVFQ